MVLQIQYADMLKRVEPLRNELKELETQAEENRLKGEEVLIDCRATDSPSRPVHLELAI